MLFFKKNHDFNIGKTGISSLEYVKIGGIEQAILIQSKNPQNPVLLFIHGGPSMPIPGVSSRNADYVMVTTTKKLIEYYTVVFWDQRGTGKSYSKDTPKETFHLKQFIQDANELTDHLRTRFHKKKIHLAAHSWGTVIALSFVSFYPEKVAHYTALSQVVNWAENDSIAYKWVIEQAEKNNDRKAIKSLMKVGEPPYVTSFKEWSILRKWLMKYHSMFYDVGDKNSPTFLRVMKIIFKSKDYSFKNVYDSIISGFRLSYQQRLIDDLNRFNFFQDASKIEVPITFIHGKKDTHVFKELVIAYYEALEAPFGKDLFWLEKSSHAFHLDDARMVESILIENTKR
jgi:pimeloyl-ACP methyl ester carboxylesterase